MDHEGSVDCRWLSLVSMASYTESLSWISLTECVLRYFNNENAVPKCSSRFSAMEMAFLRVLPRNDLWLWRRSVDRSWCNKLCCSTKFIFINDVLCSGISVKFSCIWIIFYNRGLQSIIISGMLDNLRIFCQTFCLSERLKYILQ